MPLEGSLSTENERRAQRTCFLNADDDLPALDLALGCGGFAPDQFLSSGGSGVSICATGD